MPYFIFLLFFLLFAPQVVEAKRLPDQSQCIEEAQHYRDLEGDEEKGILAKCLQVRTDNLSAGSCLDDVELYLEELSQNMRFALVDCLSIKDPPRLSFPGLGKFTRPVTTAKDPEGLFDYLRNGLEGFIGKTWEGRS